MLGCCAMTFVGLGIVNSCAGIFLKPVAEDLGVKLGSISLYTTVQGVTNIISVLLVSRILPKCRVSVLTTVSAAAICIAFGAMSQYHSVVGWYISGAVIGFAMPFCGMPLAPMIISNWFEKREGLAMGIVMAFSGVGGVVLNPIISTIITAYSWRRAYIVMALIGAVVVLPFTAFVLRLKPEEMGCLPYGAGSAADAADSGSAGGSPVTERQLVRDGRFYALLLAVLFMASYNAAVQHLSGFATESGISLQAAGGMLSVLMFTMTVGKVLMGTVIDRFGALRAMLGASALCIAGLVLMLLAPSQAVMTLGAAVFGLTAALVSVLPPAATKRVFGLESYAVVYPLITVGSAIGANFSVPVLGYLYDATGAYRVGYWLLVLLIAAAAVLYWMVLRTRRTEKKLHQIDQAEDFDDGKN